MAEQKEISDKFGECGKNASISNGGRTIKNKKGDYSTAYGSIVIDPASTETYSWEMKIIKNGGNIIIGIDAGNWTEGWFGGRGQGYVYQSMLGYLYRPSTDQNGTGWKGWGQGGTFIVKSGYPTAFPGSTVTMTFIPSAHSLEYKVNGESIVVMKGIKTDKYRMAVATHHKDDEVELLIASKERERERIEKEERDRIAREEEKTAREAEIRMQQQYEAQQRQEETKRLKLQELRKKEQRKQKEIEAFLNFVDPSFGKYSHKLLKQGLTAIEDLSSMQDEHCKLVDIPLFHWKKIIAAANKQFNVKYNDDLKQNDQQRMDAGDIIDTKGVKGNKIKENDENNNALNEKGTIKEFEEFLRLHGLEQYFASFKENECCDIRYIEDLIDDDDFLQNEIGISKKIHRKRLLRELAKLKQEMDDFKQNTPISPLFKQKLNEKGIVTMNILCKYSVNKNDFIDLMKRLKISDQQSDALWKRIQQHMKCNDVNAMQQQKEDEGQQTNYM